VNDFESAVRKWTFDTQEDVETVLHYAITELSRRIISRTPVGMPATWARRAPAGYVPGTARAGWHISTGEASVTLPTRPDAQGTATLSAIIASLPEVISGKAVYLSNNVPYIGELERGYSPQSPPSAMVALSVLEFESIVAGKAREILG
jgi:hypothetical protein